ncbi:GNAT family N-acetyltransferase [Streptomyces sp. NPDC021020]|uniref:GNAT family N-acetyltransferase n=1 Tax=Streptomyces sp. NPDC021020 TaxID=3365109 RepID=UPI0037974BD8
MARSTVELRPAAPADAAAVADVFTESCLHAYRNVLPPAVLARFVPDVQTARWTAHLRSLPTDHRITAAWQGNRIIGFVEARHPWPAAGPPSAEPARPDGTREGEVTYLFVHPGHFATGIGTRLLNAAEEWLAQAGYGSAVLWVFSDNAPARGFYERSGWAYTGIEQYDPALEKEGHHVRERLHRKALAAPPGPPHATPPS